MNFANVIATLSRRLDARQVHYALIGGYAMALRGVPRATLDLDFLLMLEDLEIADAILGELGYRRDFRSDNVSHYVNPDETWGRIDILHAFRGPSLAMLRRAERVPVGTDLSLPVATIEDIIGLKVQAIANQPSRALPDWHDIALLLTAAGERRVEIDWQLLGDYLRLFHFEGKLADLKAIHGTAH